LPRPGELASRAQEVAPGVRLVAHVGPYPSIDALKGAAKDVRDVLGSGVVALALDADEPQLFVTVSDDLVARGVSAGDLVRTAVGEIDGRGGGRPEMAQGRGTRREGLEAALAAVGAALRNGGGSA
jgi:alanyl-tRNA synthetase